MINRQALLADLQKLLARLEADLLERSESGDVSDLGRKLRAEYERAKSAERTAQNYEDWRSDAITQAAAAWVLSCVFVRFLEDNALIDPPKIAGPADRLQRARDEHELYFRQHPHETDREYLLAGFDELGALPGTKDIFGDHNPIRELPNWLSGDAAGELLRFFQEIDADTGALVHDFTDANWDTRFLGDLYQDLSEAARKKYALLQTPEFVEEFILDRTLDPAVEEVGLDAARLLSHDGTPVTEPGFRMIDPACGSGHFLLGAFRRILGRWQRQEPGTNVRELVQRTLDSIYGVDVNPYAVAIARFRLLMAAMRACGVQRLSDAPAFRLNLACGDSLLHGAGEQQSFGWRDVDQVTHAEDLPLLRKLLRPAHFHAVVGNPPYINVKDRALNEAYRNRYGSCHGKYALTAPFLERFFNLALNGALQGTAGYIGVIIGNGFMRQQFGKKLVEEYIPRWDLTHVIDTAGAYLPGHGTPTAILIGRSRRPVAAQIRTALGIQGEPGTPNDPALGVVWTSLTHNIDSPGWQNDFVSIADTDRERFHKHPWSIGGGGAADVKLSLDDAGSKVLDDVSSSIGIVCFTLEDDIFFLPWHAAKRARLPREHVRPMVVGENVRDWALEASEATVFPYDDNFAPIKEDLCQPCLRYLWQGRTCLSNNKMFGRKTKIQAGLKWYEFGRLTHHKLRSPLSVVFANVVTHNHFVLDDGEKIFNSHAPLIKLGSQTASEYLVVLELLNSSAACFWMKQVCHNKGSTVDEHGARKRTIPFEDFYEFTSTALGQFPIPEQATGVYSSQLHECASSRMTQMRGLELQRTITKPCITSARATNDALLERMIALQEELDWRIYGLFGMIDDDVEYGTTAPRVKLGERAFEIALARKVANGDVRTTWFERHNSTPITELPSDWPADYRDVVQRRIELIEKVSSVRLIEQPEYKRRWNTEPWETQIDRVLRNWLYIRLESYFDVDGRMNGERQPTARLDIALTSIARLADVARQDQEFLEVGGVCRNDEAFDVLRLVEELVQAESVPLLPILRYKASGLRKRAEWEKTWELQRREDELARQRTAANQRIAKARAILRETFSAEFQVMTELEKQLKEACVKVRDNHAPTVEFDSAFDGEQMLDWLGHKGVNIDGGPALDALMSMRKRLVEKRSHVESECEKKCAKDPEYLAALAEREAIPADPEVPVPPKYVSGDFISSGGARYWVFRGKLDVPKERWVSFPHCEGPDGTLIIAWAGYDHLQLARAISEYYVRVQTELGGSDDPRLVPLLAGVVELLPWLKQWHNEPDAAFNGLRMGDYFESFVTEEARNLNKTIEEIKAWQPPQRTAGRRRRAAT